jgi:hypothetical protein
MSSRSRIRTLPSLLAAALAVAAPARAPEAAMTRAYVACTDFSTGSLGDVNLTSRAVAQDVEPIGSDARLRFFEGLLYVVNRFGGDNIQVIDPATNNTLRQFSTGNGSNPYDISFVSPTKAYVTRYELSDLLIVNPATGAGMGSISLAPFADADGIPEMDHMIRVDRWLFVSLQRLNRNGGFQPTDSSLVVAAKNPVTAFAFDRASTRLILGCAGAYGALDGGIVAIDPVYFQSLGVLASESALGGEIGGVAWHEAAHSYAIVSDASFNTKLISWNSISGQAIATVYDPGGFSLTDLALNDRGELYVCNSSFVSPGLRVFEAGTDLALAGPLDAGLPPYVVTFDAASEQILAVENSIAAFRLESPSPNPARSITSIRYTLSASTPVEFDVFDLAGRHVIGTGPIEQGAGSHDFKWNLKSGDGRPVRAGVYVVSARAGESRASRRVVVLH